MNFATSTGWLKVASTKGLRGSPSKPPRSERLLSTASAGRAKAVSMGPADTAAPESDLACGESLTVTPRLPRSGLSGTKASVNSLVQTTFPGTGGSTVKRDWSARSKSPSLAIGWLNMTAAWVKLPMSPRGMNWSTSRGSTVAGAELSPSVREFPLAN
ncbi:MAG: hypothetical protein LBT40_10670 [Deltaproteobacteria bacterium]|nr:hypothetical protein [Deltaproteobacteria bacterium]